MGAAAGLLAATLALAGCEPRGATRSEMRRVSGPDAVVLPTRWLIAPEATADPPLAAPVALVADETRGRLLLLELQPPELRVYDLVDGSFIRALGRQGDGPGEYRYPTAVAVNRAGVAAVLSMRGRLTLWAADGSLAAVMNAGGGLATDVMAARADSFYLKIDIFPPDDVAEFRVATRDTVLLAPLFRDSGLPGTEQPGRATRNHAYAVAATPSGDLLVAPPGPDYSILRIGADGQIRQRIDRPEVEPVWRSAEEIAAIRERVRKGYAAAGRAAPQRLAVPRYRPHVARLAVAPDGTFWALTRRGEDSLTVIDSFEGDGRFVASYQLNVRSVDLAVTSASIYLLTRAALDVPAVAVASRPRRRGP